MKNFYDKENIMAVLNSPKFSDFNLSQKGALADIVSNVVNEIMYSERVDFLSKTEQDKGNGSYQRDLQTSFGKLSLNVPRTRNSDFRPTVLPDKYTRFDSSFESLVNSLLVNGDSKNEIISKLKDKGLNYSPQAFDILYDNILTKIKDFKTSILDENAFFLYIDAYHTKVKDLKDSKVKPCSVYTVISVDFNANKKIIGFYHVFGNENKDTWKSVFQDLITRGLKKVLLFICDDFSGISDAIKTFFPYSDIQKCFVHLQRNVYRHTSKEDCKDIINSLSEIKSCNSFEKAFNIFSNDIISKYSKKYPDYMKHLESRLSEYVRFLEYPKSVQKHIYTTNPVESVNSYRKSGHFQSMDSLELSFFLFIDKMNDKWAVKVVPLIKNSLYELNQIFNLKFYS